MSKQQSFSSNSIRRQFLDYFISKGHTEVASSSLIPGNDPTLLFNNAGMVQFKETFLGIEKRPYSRATSAQRCVRAGGKHNDLDNVGYTRRHHTFFEMLGNFSFGDYFKKEAIAFAWEFLTQVLQLPAEKLWISVFREDSESEAIWLNDIGINPQRISRCDEKDNFWQMGDTGPCGPCTEIFYDHGESIAGGPPGSPDEDGDRYVEIWNLVFMQYDRDANGKLNPLPRPCVDTGMGLERIAAVLQGVHDNYDIDLFQYLLHALSKIINCANVSQQSMRVIVDHIRSSAFLIADGVVPSNEGRGYVLRRIIRRAARHGAKSGEDNPFFYKMLEPLLEIMGEAYPELIKSRSRIEKVIKAEETQFADTLGRGLKQLETSISKTDSKILAGDIVFQLYDTYGFPPDLTADILREKGMTIDKAGFELAMQQQRQQSKKYQQFQLDQGNPVISGESTEFAGYQHHHIEATVVALFEGEQNTAIESLNEKQTGIVVLDKTPFYAESGGQVGDCGVLEFADGLFCVEDTQKQGAVYFHRGFVKKGILKVKQVLTAAINQAHRKATERNHTATHLLHAALHQVLGDELVQKGSLVKADYLRFDFSHHKALTVDELQQVEQQVNAQIRENHAAELSEMSPDAAKKAGAMALFGERYGEKVRVMRFGDFSTEICGGTHVSRTGDIGAFKITLETASAAGIRRIEAVTGEAAINYWQKQQANLDHLANLLKSGPDDLAKKLTQLLQKNRELEREAGSLRQSQANQQLDSLINQVIAVDGVKLLAAELKVVDSATLRNTLDQLKQRLPDVAIVLAAVNNGKIQLLASVPPLYLKRFNAVTLLNYVAQQVGGKGGGRPDMAQGGGTDVANLKNALDSVVGFSGKL